MFRVLYRCSGMKTSTVQNFENPQDTKMVKEKSIGTKDVLEKPKVVWFNVIGLGILHLMWMHSIYIMLTGKCKLITTIYTFAFSIFICGLGVTLGAHRLWSHRSYKAKLPLRLLLLFGQTMIGQCLWVWVRDHRQHHKFTDTDADPHNAQRGLFFSHMGWLMMKKHPEVKRKGSQIDMSDLEADSWVMFQKKYYNPLYLLIALAIPVALPYLFWEETLWNSFMVAYICRMMSQLHVAWSVNSFAHYYGNKPFEKEIRPAENPYVAFLALGEGWHNYHHAFPWDCNTSEFGQYFNLSSRVLGLLEYLGLAYDLRTATKEMVINRAIKHGDGSHHLYKK